MQQACLHDKSLFCPQASKKKATAAHYTSKQKWPLGYLRPFARSADGRVESLSRRERSIVNAIFNKWEIITEGDARSHLFKLH